MELHALALAARSYVLTYSTHLLALFQQFGCHVASTRTYLQHHICGAKGSLPRGKERREEEGNGEIGKKGRKEDGKGRGRKKRGGKRERGGKKRKGEKRRDEGKERKGGGRGKEWEIESYTQKLLPEQD